MTLTLTVGEAEMLLAGLNAGFTEAYREDYRTPLGAEQDQYLGRMWQLHERIEREILGGGS